MRFVPLTNQNYNGYQIAFFCAVTFYKIYFLFAKLGKYKQAIRKENYDLHLTDHRIGFDHNDTESQKQKKISFLNGGTNCLLGS